MSAQSLPRRRNGKPQACEPCRKRKIACDHALPTCQRCRRRKTTSACVYLAAPMTQKMEPGKPEIHQEIHNLSSLPALDIASPALSKLSMRSGTTATKSAKNAILTSPSVFFGPTSFSAVFHEHQSDLVSDMPPREDDLRMEATSRPNSRMENAALDEHFVCLGTKVLSRLPDQQSCDLLLKRRFERSDNDAWFKPATQRCVDLLWSTFGEQLVGPKNIAGLEAVAQILCQNATTPMEEPEDPEDAEEWIQSFSGLRLRWESLGLILASCCYGAMSSGDDAVFMGINGRPRTKKDFVRDTKESISICVTLCSHTESVNPVIVALLYNNALLLSVLGPGGDTSFLLWRHHGDLMAATTALGLHRSSESRSTKVSVRSEVRRRIYATVFNIDKTLASFTGRPPFLSHRYASCPMPLDIDDETFFMPVEERLKVVAKLKPNGWNAEGRITSGTYVRVNMCLAMVRDEILEISLGSWNECLPNCIYDLKARSEKEYSEFPSDILYRQSDSVGSGQASKDLILKLSVRTRYLQNHFLLERLAIKYGQTDGQALIDIARETLSLTVLLYTQRDRFLGYQHNFEWLIVCYGVPASGVLCFELLMQAKNPHAPRLILPRSETIQNLSLFISFLSWVLPTAADQQVCLRMKDIVSRVLDQVLEAPSRTEPPPTAGFDLPVDLFDFDAFGEFDMLGETDWTMAPWVGIA